MILYYMNNSERKYYNTGWKVSWMQKPSDQSSKFWVVDEYLVLEVVKVLSK